MSIVRSPCEVCVFMWPLVPGPSGHVGKRCASRPCSGAALRSAIAAQACAEVLSAVLIPCAFALSLPRSFSVRARRPVATVFGNPSLDMCLSAGGFVVRGGVGR
eukprot:12634778-Alexandrium_andersonii.AAC.1